MPHVLACLSRVSSPLAAVSAGGIVAIAHSSRAHVCVPGTVPYICRYARSWARVVNLGLCTSRRLVTLHSVRVASYSSAGKGLKVARRAYTSHTSNCKPNWAQKGVLMLRTWRARTAANLLPRLQARAGWVQRLVPPSMLLETASIGVCRVNLN